MKLTITIGAEHAQQVRLKILELKAYVDAAVADYNPLVSEISGDREITVIFESSCSELQPLEHKLKNEMSNQFGFNSSFIKIDAIR